MPAIPIFDSDTEATGFGKISYTTAQGTVTFGAPRKYFASSTPVMSDDGRSLKYIEATFQIQFVLQDATLETHETNMTTTSQILNTPGGNLVIEGIGLRDAISTQLGGTVPDVLNGVMPQPLRKAPIGGLSAWELIWECTWRHTNCSTTLASDSLIDFSTSSIYATDDRGWTTRTTSLSFEVARPRTATGQLRAANLQRRFEQVRVTVPRGMRRMSTVRQFNAARNRVEVTIVDREIDHFPYPEGMVNASLVQSIENEGVDFHVFAVTIAGTFEVAKGVNPARAGFWFLRHVIGVANRLRDTAQGLSDNAGGLVIPTNLRLERDKFSYTTSASITLRVFGCVRDMLQLSGIYESVPGTSYGTWIASLNRKGVGTMSGVSKYKFADSNTPTVGLCNGDVNRLPPVGNDRHNFVEPRVQRESFQLLCDSITEQNSYLSYHSKLNTLTLENIQIHRRAKFWRGIGAAFAVGSLIPLAKPIIGANATAQRFNDAANEVQYSSEGDTFIVAHGSAARIKFAPRPPDIQTLPNGTRLHKIAEKISDVEAVADFFGCPVLQIKWTIVYVAKGYVPSIDAPNNDKTLCHVGAIRQRD